MSKKAANTYHLLAMAKSLEAQNEAIGNLIVLANTAQSFAKMPQTDAKELRDLIKRVYDAAQRCRDAVWPEKQE